jgi:hypothetical protein
MLRHVAKVVRARCMEYVLISVGSLVGAHCGRPG